MLKFRVAESNVYPGDWHVEAVDADGHFYLAVFTGHRAKERAGEYATWKETSSCQERPVVSWPAGGRVPDVVHLDEVVIEQTMKNVRQPRTFDDLQGS